MNSTTPAPGRGLERAAHHLGVEMTARTGVHLEARRPPLNPIGVSRVSGRFDHGDRLDGR